MTNSPLSMSNVTSSKAGFTPIGYVYVRFLTLITGNPEIAARALIVRDLLHFSEGMADLRDINVMCRGFIHLWNILTSCSAEDSGIEKRRL